MFDDDRALEAFCNDPANDPGSIAGLLALLPVVRRRTILTSLSERKNYSIIFNDLRRVLGGGAEHGVSSARVQLNAGIDAHGWQIGDHTHGSPTVINAEHGSLTIGRYCSIAGSVRIIVSNYPMGAVASYPFATLHKLWPSAPDDFVDQDHDQGRVVIGNGVWIGEGATILPGVRIGDGAIIGAGAVVAERIAPFAVAAGNPARVKRVRFDKPTVERLMALRWWDWPDEKVDRYVPLLLSGDVVGFLNVAERDMRPLALDLPPGAS